MLFLSFLPAIALWSQNKSYRFQGYTMEDGLPQNFIDCILQDSKGFMWFGTWSGLCRFDGYSFKLYRRETEEYSSVSNNFIHSLSEDLNGNLWIGTDAGLNIYQYDLDTFTVFNEGDRWQKDLSRSITAIAGAQDGSMWLGTGSGLCHVYIDRESRITHLEAFPIGRPVSVIPGSVVNYLLSDSHGDLWICTDSSISVLDPATGNARILGSSPGTQGNNFYNVKCVYEDTGGDFWIGAQLGLWKYDPDSGKFDHFTHDPMDASSLVHNYVMSVTEDAFGNILVGTFGGLSIYGQEDSSGFVNYTENPLSQHSLTNDVINCLYRDRSQNIWIGTERGGINEYNALNTQFEYFEHEINKENGLSNNVINAILEDEDNIWIGTSGGGLNRYIKENGTYRNYRYRATEVPAFSDFISELHRDESGNLWVGTWGAGLFRLVNQGQPDEAFVQYPFDPDGAGLVSAFISSMASDDKGNLWIGTYDGLDRYNPETDTYNHFTTESGRRMMLSRIGILLFDHDENLWLGTEHGLLKMKFGPGQEDFKLKVFTHDENRQNSLRDDRVISLHEDSEHRFWIGTYGFGLNLLESEDSGGVFTDYTTRDGLSNNIVYTITEDNGGDLWLTTAYGLSRFDPGRNRFDNYYMSDGLQNNEYFWNASFRNDQGKLYFGGMKGLNAFYPDSIDKYIVEADLPVVITDLRIYNESVKPNETRNGVKVLDRSVWNADKAWISYRSKEISLEFSAMNYEQPASVKYAYMLEGLDENWNEVTSGRRFATYTNLNPGRYVFRVRSTNSLGEWTDESSDLEINIVPPFWRTWAFRIVMFLVLAGLLILYVQYRFYILKTHRRELEQLVKERTAEIGAQKERLSLQNEQIQSQRDKLADLNRKIQVVNERKLKFFTNVSHEFRTPLTLITGPIEGLLERTDLPGDIRHVLDLVDRNAQRLLHLINQLMDFRKIEKKKMQLHVSRMDINDFLENTVEAFTPLAEQKGIRFEFAALEGEPETWFDHQKVEDITYNLLSNAFKNTPNGGRILLKVTRKKQSRSHVSIEVSDNGPGISEDKLAHIFDRYYHIESRSNETTGTGIGLSLTRELVKCHKGTISVDSTVGSGTTFIVDLPAGREDFDDSDITDKPYEPSAIIRQVEKLTHRIMSGDKGLIRTGPLKTGSGKKPAVLIIEDNDELRQFIAIKLGETCRVLEARNGKAGYDLALTGNPDVIVSDIMMPEMDGLELCRKIKTSLMTSHVPVILLTARSELEDEITGLQTGADRYLAKPFHFELLHANISSLIESRKRLFEAFLVQKNLDTKILATNTTDEMFLRKIIGIIDENISDTNLNVSYLSRKMSISRSHLHKKMMALANLSPVDFINNVRLKKSIELLSDASLNISEIAYMVGYSDPKYFSRLFRRQFGTSPSRYREALQLTV